MIQYKITILDKLNNRTWEETYDSYYLYRKRCIKLSYSKRLIILSRTETNE